MPTNFRHHILSTLLIFALTTGGLNAAEPAVTSTASAAPKASGAITPDTSAKVCKLIPPEQVAEYKLKHDVFSSAPGLEPQFKKGQLFVYGDDIRFKWAQAATQPLTISVGLLQRCSNTSAQEYAPLVETAPGSGLIGTQMRPSLAGSDFPAGTPGLVSVQSTVVDMKTMTSKTKVIGEYTVRLEGSRE